MRSHMAMIRLFAIMAAMALAKGCGDGGSPTTPRVDPVQQRPAAVTVSPATAELTAVGATVQLSVEVRDQNGNVMTGAAVTWSTSNPTVATVETSGLVTAVAGGTATVTASAGTATGSAAVTVMQTVASVEVSPAMAELTAVGATVQLTAEAFDANGHPAVGAEFSWESDDPGIATVDASGLVTAVGIGTATITATVGSASGTVTVTVEENPDRAALVALYEATDGANWVNNDNWLTDAPLGEWYGVWTDGQGHVVRLDLAGDWDSQRSQWIPHGLSGAIPSELGKLAGLQSLFLGHNNLSGQIPPELGNLSNLTRLDLQSNDLWGEIPPALANLTNLTRLRLRDNSLTGGVPPELGDLSNLTWLALDANRLAGAIPSELGNLSNLERLYLSENDLSSSIPPELGNLANLESLGIDNNNLSGQIPPELGNLTNLEWLTLGSNDLGGTIPESFLQLDGLRLFFIGYNKSLCVRGTAVFVAWWRQIEDVDAESEAFCNGTDLAVLEQLYDVAGGSGWTNARGWLGDAALAGWHGVSTDALGRVTALDLADNELAGRLSGGMGSLARMTELRIGGNPGLSGRLPMSLSGLSLTTLDYAGTDLCVPTAEAFREWLRAVPAHRGTEIPCASLSDREILTAVYESMNGPSWYNSDGWLTDAPIGNWHGVETDDTGRVTSLRLGGNNLTGDIPPELGGLADLTVLVVEENDLNGPIPPEIGRLSRLEELWATESNLTGPIPAEFGNLSSLRRAHLWDNALTGSIPPEIGKLSHLRELGLANNDLSGTMPATLGTLTRLEELWLQGNELAGPIPAEFGGLTALRVLTLDGNNLRGAVPHEFGGMSELRRLSMADNRDMAGRLPLTLTGLQELVALLAGGTDLCVPSDPRFLDWLEGIPTRRIAGCDGGGKATAYLVQAVQSREFPVPLVAGEEALLRVFLTAPEGSTERIPPVRARFYIHGAEIHVAEIPSQTGFIPSEIDEGDLSRSANARIPADIVHQGLEMVIEVDPDGTLDPGLGLPKRIPETGRMAVDVREMPLFDLTVVPFLWAEAPDSAVVDAARAMATDPEGAELLSWTRTLLPVGDLAVRAHAPVVSSSNNSHSLLSETAVIRAMEGTTGHYLGMMSGPVTGPSGIAYGPGRESFSVPGSGIIAHELGHNMSLWHAPCGAVGVDPSFPYRDGSTGAWGYDLPGGGDPVPPTHFDLMSYCGPKWISDYHFANALRFRVVDENRHGRVAAAESVRSLLLWGGAGPEGEPVLEPAFVVDAPALLPDSTGMYEITGRSDGGEELFSLSFAMREVPDGDGSSSFAFVIPAQRGWEGSLDSITLTGPAGSFTLDADSDLPMAVLRDPSTGQVRGILRDLPASAVAQAVADAAGPRPPGFDVLFSRGIPETGAWRR